MSVTASAPYALPSAAGVEIKPLLTVGDKADNGYEMMGIPDGMGAYDNGDGTFTLLMNHELRPTVGGVRAHGSTGAFVSKYVIRKSDFSVLSGEDLIKTTYLWENGAFVAKTTQLNRLCSADLPAVTAFFNPATGLGTTDRIFMNGEETNSGRSFAHVVTGPDAGTSWELPWTGKYAWENHVASPYVQDKTVVMGLDDSRREFSSEGATEPSEVYVWVGNKKESGSTIERAGLVDGILHGMRVGTPGNYDANESTVTSGERFELVEMSDQTNNSTFQPLQTESIAKSITQFRRVEDGHFDPHNPNVFYFVTTDQFSTATGGGQTRLWRLTFDDITNPEAGGVIEIAVDSPSSAPGEMFDNMTTNYNGDVLLQEDPGGQAYLAKIWQHDASTGDLIQVAEHNPFFFADSDRATPGNQFLGDLNPFVDGNQGTIDEESSGIIDLSAILGPGYYMINVQAHSALPDPYVEAGQLLIMNTNAAKATLGSDGVLSVTGTVNDDGLAITRSGQTLSVAFNGRTLGTFDNAFVNSIVVSGHAGSDTITVEENVVTPALLDGGLGDDVVRAGSADSVLVGGQGKDDLRGGAGEDVLIGDATSLDASALLDGLRTWTAGRNYQVQVSSLSIFSTSLVEDDDLDVLDGVGARDWMLDALLNDTIVSRQAGEAVN